jgi:hypothetical protein
MQVPVAPTIDTQELVVILQGLLGVYIDLVYETSELKRRIADLERQLAESSPTPHEPEYPESLLDISNVDITELL